MTWTVISSTVASWELFLKIPWMNIDCDGRACSPPGNKPVFAGGLEKTFLPLPLTFLKASTGPRRSAACLVKDAPNNNGVAAQGFGSIFSKKDTKSLLYSSRIYILWEYWVAALPRKAKADWTASLTIWKSRVSLHSPLLNQSSSSSPNRSASRLTTFNINICRQAKDWSVDLTAGRDSAPIT